MPDVLLCGMNRILLLIILLTGLMPGLAPMKASGQTCRVKAGNSAGGHRSYIEVYEYDYVKEKPSFPGGDANLVSFINTHRQYPKEAYKNGIQGRVTCSFVVNADGTVSHISILKGVEPSLNNEAIRIMSLMPEWKPGRHDGKAVPVRVVWSVPFRK